MCNFIFQGNGIISADSFESELRLIYKLHGVPDSEVDEMMEHLLTQQRPLDKTCSTAVPSMPNDDRLLRRSISQYDNFDVETTLLHSPKIGARKRFLTLSDFKAWFQNKK